MRQIGPVQIRHRQFAEDVIQNRRRIFNRVIALHHARGLKFGEGERINKFLKRHAILQTNRHGDGKVVHHRPEPSTLFVHVDEDLAEIAVFIFTGAQVNFVPANDRFLGVSLTATGQFFTPTRNLFDHHFLDDLFGQSDCFVMWRARGEDFFRLFIIFHKGRSQRLRQF